MKDLLKDYILSKKHHQYRISIPENLAKSYKKQNLPPIERMVKRFEKIMSLETPHILPNEKITFSRSVSNLPPIFTEDEWGNIKSKHFIHELGYMSNLSPNYEDIISKGLLEIRKTANEYGLGNPTDYSFQAFKTNIEEMLVAYYGRSEVIRKNKCLTIKGNTNRIQIDVVPTWRYRRYDYANNRTYSEGVVLYGDDNQYKQVINYPKQHITNGISKNTDALRRFKRLTRIFKNVRIRMDNDSYHPNENITSFLLECLAFNVPTSTYVKNRYTCSWNDILKDSIYYLWDNTKEDSTTYNEWGEVSELLYLMRGHKWSRQDVHDYMYWMWNYLQLG